MMVRLVRKILADIGVTTIVHATSGRDALESLEGVDVVLLDHQLPDTTGLAVLEAIRARPHPPAVILVTAHGNESLAATALRQGADDYLAKDVSLNQLLPQVLERVRRTRELRKALVAAEQDLVRAERLAAIGEMTVTLHHEINNPLMAAFAQVDLLLADPAMDADARRETLGSVRDALHRIRDIVRRIGDLRAVRTKSYATGTQMVDLDDVGPAATDRQREGPGPAERGVPRAGRLAPAEARRVRSGAGRGRGPPGAAGGLRPARDWWSPRAAPTRRAPAARAGSCRRRDRDYRVVALVSGNARGALAAAADRVLELPFDPASFAADILQLTDRA